MRRHLLAVGVILVIAAVCLFFIISYSHSPPVISVADGEVIINLTTSRLGALALLAVSLGALGIGVGGYSIMRRKADKREMDEALGINKLKRK